MKYEKGLEEAAALISEHNASLLRTQYGLGRIVHLVQKDGRYGDDVVGRFAEELAETSPIAYREKTLYQFVAFYRAVSKPELERLIAMSVSFRKVLRLITGKKKLTKQEWVDAFERVTSAGSAPLPRRNKSRKAFGLYSPARNKMAVTAVWPTEEAAAKHAGNGVVVVPVKVPA